MLLSTPADFDNAIYFQTPVSVWQDGRILDYGGIIQSHTDEAVRINDAYYLKSVCEFRSR